SDLFCLFIPGCLIIKAVEPLLHIQKHPPVMFLQDFLQAAYQSLSACRSLWGQHQRRTPGASPGKNAKFVQFVLVLETGKKKLRHAAKYGEMGAGQLSQQKSECHVMQNRQNTIARLQSFMDLGIKKYVSSQKLLCNL
ncbi:MAG: hypothetical protein OIF54_18890, partial [Cohaesibacter sp.]|nr:hypothetical protein [Cohaesibacter sp.]